MTRWPSFVYVPQPCNFIMSVACVYSVALCPSSICCVFVIAFWSSACNVVHLLHTVSCSSKVRVLSVSSPSGSFVSPSTASQNNHDNTENSIKHLPCGSKLCMIQADKLQLYLQTETELLVIFSMLWQTMWTSTQLMSIMSYKHKWYVENMLMHTLMHTCRCARIHTCMHTSHYSTQHNTQQNTNPHVSCIMYVFFTFAHKTFPGWHFWRPW